MKSLNPHVVLYTIDDEGNKRQIFPQTDIGSIIGMGDTKGGILDKINKLDDRVKALERKINYR